MGNERNLGRIARMANDIVLKENTTWNSEKGVGKIEPRRHGKTIDALLAREYVVPKSG